MVYFLRNLDITKWEDRIEAASDAANSRWTKYAIIGLLMFVCFLVWLRNVLAGSAESNSKVKKPGRIRNLIAGAISLIAPKLGKWVRDGTTQPSSIEFYYRMAEILQRHHLIRSPSQTHREFAREVSQEFGSHPKSGLISSTVHEVTELFNGVRFGKEELETELSQQIETSLEELDAALQIPS